MDGGASFLNGCHEECSNARNEGNKKDQEAAFEQERLRGYNVSRGRKWGMWIACKDIAVGEQLCWCYGRTYFQYSHPNFRCAAGARYVHKSEEVNNGAVGQ